MTETVGPTATPLRHLVVGEPNPPGLAIGTLLEERRRFEGWDHQGCIDSVRSVVGEMNIVDGPRAGEVVEVALESSYEYDPPFWRATYLLAVGSE
jgi:hypothetical protein